MEPLNITVNAKKVFETKKAVYNLKKKDLNNFPALYEKLKKRFGKKYSICKISTAKAPDFWEDVEKISPDSSFLDQTIAEVGQGAEDGTGSRQKSGGKLLTLTIDATQNAGRYVLDNTFANSKAKLKSFVETTISKYKGKNLQELVDMVTANPAVKVVYPTDLGFSLLNRQKHGLNFNTIANLLNLEIFPLYTGINTSYFYIGIHASVSADHREDCGFGSLNLCHFVSDSLKNQLLGCKIWISPDPKYHTRIIELLNKQVRQRPFCSNILMQKIHKLTAEWFEIHGIPYHVFFQEPGDIILTFPGGIHSVTNVGLIFNEAINFALPDWAISSKNIDNCGCGKPDCVPSKLPGLDRRVLAREWKKKQQTNTTQKKNKCAACGKIFKTRTTLYLHKTRVHDLTSRKYGCTKCAKKFCTTYDLKRHHAVCKR